MVDWAEQFQVSKSEMTVVTLELRAGSQKSENAIMQFEVIEKMVKILEKVLNCNHFCKT